MKHYALCFVDKATGLIDHMATSSGPLEDDKVGTPEDAAITHQLIRFEFDAEPDTGEPVFRARQALEEFEMNGANPAAKSSPTATVKVKAGRTRASNILEGTRKP